MSAPSTDDHGRVRGGHPGTVPNRNGWCPTCKAHRVEGLHGQCPVCSDLTAGVEE